MNLKNIDWKNERNLKRIIYFIFACFMFVQHYPLVYVGDDLIMGPGVDTYTLWENFLWHWDYNGRIFTDVFANIWYRMPMMIWKIFDTGIFTIIAFLISRIFTKNRVKNVALVCILMLLFPFNYMESAGYIATTGNYLYPMFCVLMILFHLTYVREERKLSKWVYLSTALSILYATNHDQTGIALVAGLLMYFIYLKVTKDDNKTLIKHVGTIFTISTISYVLNFLIPGHLNRMKDVTEEMDAWAPQYADWTFIDKVYHGYSTTVANLFFNDVKLFILFTVLIFLLGLKQKNLLLKITGFLPMGLALIDDYARRFVVYFDFSYSMPDLVPPGLDFFPTFATIVALVCIFYTIWNSDISMQRKWYLTMMLVLAAGTREMMGFSFTLYASSFRTFTFFLFALIACCITLFHELEEDTKNPSLSHIAIGSMLALLII